MATFKSLSSATKHVNGKLESIVKSSIEEVVNRHIIPTMIKNIERVVYDAYTPQGIKAYERRKAESGLLDPNNIKCDVKIKNNRVEVRIRNFAKVSGREISKSGFEYQLDWLIVDGQADWEKSVWYGIRHSRDFYKATIEEMEDELPKLLNESFKKRGLKIKFKVYFI